MAHGRLRRTFLGDLDPAQNQDALLRYSLDAMEPQKNALRDALAAAGAHPRIAHPSAASPGTFGARQPIAQKTAARAAAQAGAPLVSDPQCTVDYDANRQVTKVLSTALIHYNIQQMAAYLDPRSWGCGNGAIAGAFLVEDRDATYVPRLTLNGEPVGKLPLGDKSFPREPVLLWEYARSDIASFENILSVQFGWDGSDRIQATYHLYDCLLCTYGTFTAPGGLILDEGYVRAEARDATSTRIEVLKTIRVRDFTPLDPGDPFDFGQWVNQTIGAALSVWVSDTSLLAPVA
jgi:hypothetical protein